MNLQSRFEKISNPLYKAVETIRLRQVGDAVLRLKPGSFEYSKTAGARFTAKECMIVTIDSFSDSYSIVTKESKAHSYAETFIEVVGPDYYDTDLPAVTAVRRTYKDGIDSPEEASFPPSSEDTPGAHLYAGAVLHAINRVIDAQHAPAFVQPVTQ